MPRRRSEPEDQVKVDVADRPKQSFKDFMGKEKQLPGQAKSRDVQPDIDQKVATGDETRRKVSQIQMDDQSLLFLLNANLDDMDEISDEEAAALASIDITRPDTTTLPAVISKSMMAAGYQEPEFHWVKHLPGYLSSGIRAMGRAVFEPFTSTRIEEINVIANVQGQGPNEDIELNSVLGFLEKYGTKNTSANLDFIDKIPGYTADVKVYTFANYTFMAVQDHAGNYIYSWPSTDSKFAIEDDSMDAIEHQE